MVPLYAADPSVQAIHHLVCPLGPPLLALLAIPPLSLRRHVGMALLQRARLVPLRHAHNVASPPRPDVTTQGDCSAALQSLYPHP